MHAEGVQEKHAANIVMEQQAREISALRAYEEQLSHMTHALSKMEGALRQEQEEKVREGGREPQVGFEWLCCRKH